MTDEDIINNVLEDDISENEQESSTSQIIRKIPLTQKLCILPKESVMTFVRSPQ
jgi:hypothetical protein